MAERARKQKSTSDRTNAEEQVETKVAPKGEKLKAELDDLLDETVEVLEATAENSGRGNVQKGGQ